MTTKELVVIDGQTVPVKAELSVPDVIEQVQKIQAVMHAVMKSGEHYGVIPGTNKPTLLKPGAEKLCLTFRLDPQYEVVTATETNELATFTMRCTLYHIPSGERIASGMGSCSSRERKYRSRDPWDMHNTVLKMASKRALVAAVLNGTAASDIFTQDLEDMPREQPQRQGPVNRNSVHAFNRTVPGANAAGFSPPEQPIEAVVAEVLDSLPEDGEPEPPHPRATFVERDADGDGRPYFDLDGVLFSVEATRKGPVWATADLCPEHGTRYFAKPTEPDSKHVPAFMCKGDGAMHPYVAPGDDL